MIEGRTIRFSYGNEIVRTNGVRLFGVAQQKHILPGEGVGLPSPRFSEPQNLWKTPKNGQRSPLVSFVGSDDGSDLEIISAHE